MSRPDTDRGYRGYIGSRPLRGHRVPQHVQNLVIRDYARRHGLRFLLSATEYAMPGCYLMLDDVLAGLDRLDGVIAYSLFMLPRRPPRRAAIYRRVLDCGRVLHFAVEGIVIAGAADVPAVEDMMRIDAAVAGGTTDIRGLG